MQKMAGRGKTFFLRLVFFSAVVFSSSCTYLGTEDTGIYYLPIMESVTAEEETAGAAAITRKELSLIEETAKEIEKQGIKNTEHTNEIEMQTEPEMAAVYVCGAVRMPGVYYLPMGARAYQAVEAAGGFKEEARQEAVNLAGYIQDGQQLYIPKIDEQGWETLTAASTASAAAESEDAAKIAINYASKEELMQLPGIGEAKAEAIIAYREEHGAFAVKEDIMLVSGIKEAAYLKLKDKIIVN